MEKLFFFGKDTAYSVGHDTFEFTEDGNSYSTWTVTLYKVANGNFQTYPITAAQFRNAM